MKVRIRNQVVTFVLKPLVVLLLYFTENHMRSTTLIQTDTLCIYNAYLYIICIDNVDFLTVKFANKFYFLGRYF